MRKKETVLTKPIRALNRALKQELMLGHQQLALANAQSEALIAGEHARAVVWTEESRAILARQEAAERERRQAAFDLAVAAGMEVESESALPSLSQLVLRLPVEDAKRLLATRRQILAVDQEIQAINERNRPLLESALDFVQFSLDTLTGLILKPAKYGANPNAVTSPTFYIDRKA